MIITIEYNNNKYIAKDGVSTGCGDTELEALLDLLGQSDKTLGVIKDLMVLYKKYGPSLERRIEGFIQTFTLELENRLRNSRPV
jgi:hypothetical protein